MVEQHPDRDTVLAAVAAVPAGAFIATDADGTIWAADVGDDLVRCAALGGPWAAAEVDVERYLGLMESDYVRGCLTSAELTRGRDPQVMRAALAAFYEPRLGPRTWLLDALARAADRGVKVWVVSASPRIAAEAGLALLDLDWPAIGIEPEGDEPWVFVEPPSVGEGKVGAWLREGLPRPALALGDSKWDLPLLESAERGLRLTHARGDLK